MGAKFGQIEGLVVLVVVFLVAFSLVNVLCEGWNGLPFRTSPGTGFMFQMSTPIIRAYNGVVRPWRGEKTPTVGQDNPDVMPSVVIGGSAPTTPEPLAPYASFPGL